MRLARLRWLLGLMLVAVRTVLLGALPAAAQSRIDVPDGCGSEAEFRREIERLTGRQAPADVPASLVIEAVGGGREGYELRLALGYERRVLRDPECRILWRSALVIVAAARREAPPPSEPPAPPSSDPAAAPSSQVPSAPPGPPAPPTRGAPAANPPERPSAPSSAQRAAPREGTAAAATRQAAAAGAPRSQRRPRPPPAARARPPASAGRGQGSAVASRAPRRSEPTAPRAVDPAFGVLRMGVDLGLGVTAGVVPDLGAVLDLGARMEVPPWALAVSLRYWPEQSGSREGRAVNVSGLGARLAGLFRVAPAWSLMVGLEVNRLVGEGSEGVSDRSSAPAWQLAPTLGLSVITWDHRYLRIELGAAGRASLIRPEFEVTGFGDLYRVPVLGADAIIRGAWLFR